MKICDLEWDVFLECVRGQMYEVTFGLFLALTSSLCIFLRQTHLTSMVSFTLYCYQDVFIVLDKYNMSFLEQS